MTIITRSTREESIAPLKNQKHELFAQNIATAPKTGMSIAQAYIASGYAAREHAAESNVSRLLKNTEVQTRIAELVASTVRKVKATVDTLAQQFDAVFDGAMGSARRARQRQRRPSCSASWRQDRAGLAW
jgi:hypothetical protein